MAGLFYFMLSLFITTLRRFNIYKNEKYHYHNCRYPKLYCV